MPKLPTLRRSNETTVRRTTDAIRHAIWIAVLRPFGDDITIEAVLSVAEARESNFDLRVRFNPDIRLVTLQLPANTSRDQVVDAFFRLTDTERRKLYNLPQHYLVS